MGCVRMVHQPVCGGGARGAKGEGRRRRRCCEGRGGRGTKNEGEGRVPRGDHQSMWQCRCTKPPNVNDRAGGQGTVEQPLKPKEGATAVVRQVYRWWKGRMIIGIVVMNTSSVRVWSGGEKQRERYSRVKSTMAVKIEGASPNRRHGVPYKVGQRETQQGTTERRAATQAVCTGKCARPGPYANVRTCKAPVGVVPVEGRARACAVRQQ